jgi:pyruvate kinase
VVVTSGTPFGISGTTNILIVESIGAVLVRGVAGPGAQTYGNISIVITNENIQPYSVRGKPLLIMRCDESYLPLIKESKGVILQNSIDDVESETYLLNVATSLNKPCIIRADGAMRTLKEGQLVTLSAEKGLVYKGVVFK